MPDTFPNPAYGVSPIAESLARLGKVLTSGPDEATRMLAAEKALAQRRTNENTSALADTLARLGTPGFDRGYAINTAVRAGYDPKDLSAMERYSVANTFGALDPRTTNAFVGAGGAYSSTGAGFRESEANQMTRHRQTLDASRAQFDDTPQVILTPTGPEIARRKDSYGRPAVESLTNVQGGFARNATNRPGGIDALTDTEKRFIGAEGKGNATPRNYAVGGENFITNDGITDARTGRQLPPGGAIVSPQGSATDVGLTKPVQGNIQGQDIAHQKFKALLGLTRQAAGKDPMNFGLPGFVKGTLQDVGVLGQSVAQGLGYDGIQNAVGDIRAKAAASGVNPSLLMGLYDPSLGELHTLSDLTVFAAAEALANQQGRSVSDKDVTMFKEIAGDPRAWLMNQQKYTAKLDTMERVVDSYSAVNRNALRGGGASPPAAPAAPGAPPSPQAPGAPQRRIRIDAQGNVLP